MPKTIPLLIALTPLLGACSGPPAAPADPPPAAAPPAAGAAPAAATLTACSGWGAPAELGRIEHAALLESSGLALSRRDPDLLWTHNDHGSGPTLYALGRDGRRRGTLRLSGAPSEDWEDLAAGAGPDGTPRLWVGDTGNNDGARGTVRVLRLDEPTILEDEGQTKAFDTLLLQWPDTHHDVEGLAVDPLTGALLLVSKESKRARFFSADAHAPADSEQRPSLVGELDLSGPAYDGGRKATAMDFSPDGRHLFVRTKKAVTVYTRTADQSLPELLQTTPCLAPSPNEPDSEALAATAEGFVSTSEGAKPRLWEVRREP